MRSYFWNVFIFLAGASVLTYASMQIFNGSGTDIGQFHQMSCGDGINCQQSAGKLSVSVSSTFFMEQATLSANTSITSSMCGASVIAPASVSYTATLPAASSNLGCRVSFSIGGAFSGLTIDPNGTDRIYEVTDSAGDSVYARFIGRSMTLESVGSGVWAVVSHSGSSTYSFTDNN